MAEAGSNDWTVPLKICWFHCTCTVDLACLEREDSEDGWEEDRLQGRPIRLQTTSMLILLLLLILYTVHFCNYGAVLLQ